MSVYDLANAVGPYRYSDPGVRPKAVRTLMVLAYPLNVKASLIRGLIKTGELRAIQVCSRPLQQIISFPGKSR